MELALHLPQMGKTAIPVGFPPNTDMVYLFWASFEYCLYTEPVISVSVQLLASKFSRLSPSPLEEAQKYFVFAEDGSLQGFESTDGRLISLGRKLLINIFSREQSFECKMTGFNNYPGIKVARMGGGFRLQLSQLAFEDRKPVFRFSTVFTFDDVGPRSISLSSHYDKCVPHVTTVVDLGYENRHFIKKKTSSHPETMGASIDARNLAHYVVDKLVENDGESLAILFLSLLEVSPLPGQHSIEGIFSFTKDDGGLVLRGPEVYDFDGLDTTSVWVKNKGLMVPEGERRIELKKKFMRAQLRCIESRDTRKMRTLFQAGLRADLKSVVKSEDIILEIDRSVKNHFRDFKFGSLDNEKALGFTHKLTGPVALGRLLKYLTSIEWQPSENRYTSVYENKENKFIKVSVRGFDLAFWLKDETLIDTSNIRRMGTRLSKALGRQIVTAHFSYLREGD